MIAGTVPYQHAGTPAWLIPARLPLWYMEAIASMYTILASIGCGPHKMCDRRPLHSVISGSICVRAGERFCIGFGRGDLSTDDPPRIAKRVAYSGEHM